ncbi:uncharacterized protein Dwil_GK27753, partial [Drosophila willistoni]
TDSSELVFIESPWSTPCLVLNGYMYNCHSRKNNKQYWRCHNYSKKVHEQRCRSRCVLENGKLKSITGGLHNHLPHTEKIDKIIQRNRLGPAVSVNTSAGIKLERNPSITHLQLQPDLIEEQQHLATEAPSAPLQMTEHEFIHFIHD